MSWPTAAAVESGAGLIPALSLVLSVASVAFGGLATYLVTRRKASGKIGTSDAGALWGESKAMRDTLTAQVAKVEEQRDRLIDAQAGQVLPVLASVSESLAGLAHSLEAITGRDEAVARRQHHIIAMLEQLTEAIGNAGQTAPENPREGR